MIAVRFIGLRVFIAADMGAEQEFATIDDAAHHLRKLRVATWVRERRFRRELMAELQPADGVRLAKQRPSPCASSQH